MFSISTVLMKCFSTQPQLFGHVNSFLDSDLLNWYMCCCTGQQDETLCKNYISEIKDLRLRIEDCEAGTVSRIRKPMDKEPLKECVKKTTEQKVPYIQDASHVHGTKTI